jgi:hypothetical protein
MTKRMLIDATHAEETRVADCWMSPAGDFDVDIGQASAQSEHLLAKVVGVGPGRVRRMAATGTASPPSAKSIGLYQIPLPTGSA